ncbi:MBL fold metallo-hydrolase [Candidatus Microgenomates bacterium]|jgi:glyoxylase-like metal-dependent hydrolase (beta-lactamase superfamily II)|nr:MAG: MBL fold metallo-hydrolase [Candidatus Microgenomates bacterium]
MEIETFSVGELNANCYLVYNSQNKNCIIIDPGDEGNFLSERVIFLKLNPLLIVATHGHFDHVLATGELQTNFKIPFAINFKDLFLLKNSKNSASYWLNSKVIILPPDPSIDLEKEENISLEGMSFNIIKTPGHTPGSVCLHFPQEKVIFSGDTLFEQGIGRTDFSYSSEKDYKDSIKRFSEIDPYTIVYPGHGSPVLLKEALQMFA